MWLKSALFQTLIQLGGAFGLSLTTVISSSFTAQAEAAGQTGTDALLPGLHAAFWLGAGLSGASLVLAAVALRGMGAIGKGMKRKKAEGGVAEEGKAGSGPPSSKDEKR